MHQGVLKHGNPARDPSTAPRCGARTRNGGACRAPAMQNPKTGRYTRCRMHGGCSTGPRTRNGLERCRKGAMEARAPLGKAVAARKRRAAKSRKIHAELRSLPKLLSANAPLATGQFV